MRSPIGPILVLLGLGTTLVLVLLLIQTMGLRSDLDEARTEVAALQAQVDAQAEPMTANDLTRGLEELEAGIRDWLVVTDADGDPSQPAGGGGTVDELVDRLDEVLERITALDRRVDEICEGVPVC